jgi:hypothetical protein
MKKLFIATLLFIGIVSFAQDINQKPARDQKEKLTPEQRNEKHLKKLTTELSLNADQQKKVSELLSDRSTKMEMLKKSRKDTGVPPTDAEKKAMKKQMEEDHKATDVKMKAILNADQYTKWTAIQKEHKDKMKDHKKDPKQ